MPLNVLLGGELGGSGTPGISLAGLVDGQGLVFNEASGILVPDAPPLGCLYATGLPNGSQTALGLTVSVDGGKTWMPCNIVGPTLPTGYIRNSWLTYYNGQYVLAFTNLSANGSHNTTSTFSLATSPGPVGNTWTFTYLGDVSCAAAPGQSGVSAVWTCDMFTDSDASLHAIIAVSSGALSGGYSVGPFTVYEMHPTAANLSTWSTPVTMSGLPYIFDPYVLKIGSTYHLFGTVCPSAGNPADHTDNRIGHYTASSLAGPWTLSSNTSTWGGSWTGTYYEGPAVIETAPGVYRMYVNAGVPSGTTGVFQATNTTPGSLDAWPSPSAANSELEALAFDPSVYNVPSAHVAQDLIICAVDQGATPTAALQHSTSLSIPNTTFTTILYDTVLYDDLLMGAPASGTITIPVAGTYLIQAGISWASGAGTERYAAIVVGGGNLAAVKTPIPTSLDCEQNLSVVRRLAAGIVVHVVVYQDSGGALNVINDYQNSPVLSVTRLGV